MSKARYWIDKIDAKLGDVDKEIKMDKTVIAISIGFIVFSAIIILLASFFQYRFLVAIAIVCGFMAVLFLYILMIMVRELHDDIEKKKGASQQ